jgi:hypothetical protein
MRRFVEECPAQAIGQQPADQFAVYQLMQSIPPEFQGSLPTVEELEAELQGELPLKDEATGE